MIVIMKEEINNKILNVGNLLHKNDQKSVQHIIPYAALATRYAEAEGCISGRL